MSLSRLRHRHDELEPTRHPENNVDLQDTFHRKPYADFKHRLWLSWYYLMLGSTSLTPEIRERRRMSWLAMMRRTGADEDLWLWEEEDEEYLEKALQPFGDLKALAPFRVDDVPVEDLCVAFEALERGKPRSPTKVFTRRSPQIRVRVIAWFIVAGPSRQEIMRDGGSPSLTTLITDWGSLFYNFFQPAALAVSNTRCAFCRVSHLLPIWVDTMLQFCFLDDLKSIPWWPACTCLARQISISTQEGRQIPTAHNPMALRFLYEAVVSPWPLILWMTFRTVRDGQLETFLNFLHNSPPDLFAWDEKDDSYLTQTLAFHGPHLSKFPGSWRKYLNDLDLKHWLYIHNITWTVSRRRHGEESTARRIGALTHLFKLDSFSLGEIPPIFRVITGGPNQHKPPVEFKSADFWVNARLEYWLVELNEELGYAVRTLIQTAITPTTCMEPLKCMDLILGVLPRNLAAFAHLFTLKKSERADSDKLQQILDRKQDVLQSLTSYSSAVNSLLLFLKQSCRKTDQKASHIISQNVHERMNRDVFVLVVQLVLFLRDRGSHQRFMERRGTDAQRFMDLLQDLLDYDGFSPVRPLLFKALLRLSRASGLHPTCFPLSGLHKVGHQVAAGGFGDIWRGSVGGQSVAIKIMRLFRDADVKTMMKEFGREALIWRQLCHPNLLPFFGLYYLENRLCLVSPWMENGNILEFFRNLEHPHDIDRLSLILDVALGLKYLHENRVIHGDLKAINILVTPSRRACIADFGLSSVADAMTLRFTHTTASNTRAGTARYQAPELFRGGKTHFDSDVYAFACVCYEILTGKAPFHELPTDAAVIFAVLEGKRPSLPILCSGITELDSLWDLLETCWKDKADMRPSATQIVDWLVSPLIRAKTTHSTTDWDETFSSKFRRSVQVQPLLPSVTQIERLLFGDDVVKACTECFRDQISSQPTRKNGELERQPKRPLEETTSDSDADEDVSPIRPSAKRMKTSEGNPRD
ncbi:hypothetical protein FB451DRAFT_686485 [Mycena latifolia]|nr:hypothetical protein FB451DRAFT_686485 [Mycena latifolia]